MADPSPRFCIGIDLGTSNSVIAYAPLAARVKAAGQESRAPAVRILDVPQVVAPGEVDGRAQLPSAIYHPDENELAPGDAALPWDDEPRKVVGEGARRFGLGRPDRLVTSAKSWLCHDAVDRRAPILPWGAPREVPRVSPVKAQAEILAHMRAAWDHELARRTGSNALANQDVVLCVPASFDETARTLTVEAAQGALDIEVGKRLVLLEEPLAALYAWLATREDRWADRLAAGERVLVIDVGGGTTDLSLVAVREDESAAEGVSLERTAVSDHLLLGGDNMDLTLARLVEQRLPGEGELSPRQWHELVQSCRVAKETLLGGKKKDLTVGVGGGGSKLVGGGRRTTITADEVAATVLDGFFPIVPTEALPERRPRTGLAEFGLPYATEPAVTRHLLAFLRRHADPDDPRDRAAGGVTMARPDAVLFNGGPFRVAALRNRLIEAITAWFAPVDAAYKPRVLRGETPELSVAVGAAYFAMIRRREEGPRIRGGLARSYYVGVDARANGKKKAKASPAGSEPSTGAADPPQKALCLVPRGLEEGTEVEVDRDLTVRTNRPVSFGLFASTSRTDDGPGDVVEVAEDDEQFLSLAPLATVLRTGKKRASTESVPVRLRARLTEVGTLEMWLAAREDDRRWRLEFGVRARGEGDDGDEGAADDLGDDAPAAEPSAAHQKPSAEPVPQGIDPQKVNAAVKLIRRIFEATGPEAAKPLTYIMRRLEDDLGLPRDSWPKQVVRKFWDEALSKVAERRLVSREHEARWFNLAGFCLRPGIGAHLDGERVKAAWKVYLKGVTFHRNTQSRIEWFILWRRLAGGLSDGQQAELMSRLMPILSGSTRQRLQGQEREEAWRLAGSLERAAAKRRQKLGNQLLDLLLIREAPRAALWTLGRLGARAPVHAPTNVALHPDVVAAWVERLLDRPPEGDDIKRNDLMFCFVQLGRMTGDRGRDLPDALRARVIETLAEDLEAPEQVVRHLQEVVPYEAAEQRVLLADSLPPGLVLDS